METIINSIGEEVKIFGDIVESEALEQITKLSECEPYQKSHIRIMPDVHAGKGCTIGTTMWLDGAVTPNLVGVDIGCGMYVVPLGKVDIDLEKFDKVVNEKVPSGFNIHDKAQTLFHDLYSLYCRESIDLDMAQRSIGSIGGGNHFIELNADDEGNKYLVIHSGSRNLGVRVCGHYQRIAERKCDPKREDRAKIIAALKAQGRESEIQSTLKAMRYKVDKDLAYLQGVDMDAYLHDMDIAQKYAMLNRETIATLILSEFTEILGKTAEQPFHTIHNYIEVRHGYLPMLRKGAVSAYKGERLIIPMNMRDGSLICIGKGNPDWNGSAPHGAGRLMSRKKAKEAISMAEFEKTMDGIYSTSVCEDTLDEAPQAYKPMQSIIDAIGETVTIEKIIRPIYNFKAKN
ncbi:MAG: RtcB family protein [Muribaculaceae bacterium]|nr:RtcB family protein [Muribaculaceae bacterium]